MYPPATITNYMCLNPIAIEMPFYILNDLPDIRLLY